MSDSREFELQAEIAALRKRVAELERPAIETEAQDLLLAGMQLTIAQVLDGFEIMRRARCTNGDSPEVAQARNILARAYTDAICKRST